MVRLQPIHEQVVVITGASSGIGLCTARMAARRGARVVLAARDADALRRVCAGLTAEGLRSIHVACDVADLEQVRNVAARAVEAFGRIDTWVNNAGVSVFGRLQDVPLEDHRRLFETNFWGAVHGSLVALEHLGGRGGDRDGDRGGALINVGSAYSHRAVPLQGMYGASKHALRGFTDALRAEVEAEGSPVSVTLVKPGGIDTPYPAHAGNYMQEEPKNPGPLYAPETVARAILFCAQHPRREVFVGATARLLHSVAHWAPRLMDHALAAIMPRAQRSSRPASGDRHGALFEPQHDGGQERGGAAAPVLEHSLYTAASLHPLASLAVVAGVGALAATLLGGAPRPASRTARARGVLGRLVGASA